MVEVFYEDTEVLDVGPEFFVSWLSELCDMEDRVLGDLTVVFCSDNYLLDMNVKHLNHDYYTDIITFDYCEDRVVSGDLFVSVDRVRENAGLLGEMFHVELNRVVAHGVLHLIGYGDKTKEQAGVMREKEGVALSLIVSRET
ncbi:MAG: rRNA maturation RNase YbeY [Crocinitomicaceae bacterium]|nr:rRNA maturation RNase YbeY [Crocinitomicaceae bacterium]